MKIVLSRTLPQSIQMGQTIEFSKFLITVILVFHDSRIVKGKPYPDDETDDENDTSKISPIDDTGIQCPHRGGEGKSSKPNFADWEFYTQPSGSKDTSQNETSQTVGITFLDMNVDGPPTPPYDTEDMRVSHAWEEDTEYLQSEWRQNWTRKTNEEKFEEVLQHAKHSTLVNWYQYGLEQWKELEALKKCVEDKQCDESKLHEPVAAAEVRINNALRLLAKYIGKFQYGEATGVKTM